MSLTKKLWENVTDMYLSIIYFSSFWPNIGLPHISTRLKDYIKMKQHINIYFKKSVWVSIQISARSSPFENITDKSCIATTCIKWPPHDYFVVLEKLFLIKMTVFYMNLYKDYLPIKTTFFCFSWMVFILYSFTVISYTK